MADLTITAANVGTYSTDRNDFEVVTLGETATRGQSVYRKTDGKYWLAQADGTSAEADAKGVVQVGGSADAQGIIQKRGGLNPGATVAVGTTYAVSATAGGIAPIADLVTGDFVTILGTATTASRIELEISAKGIEVA